MVLVIFSRRDKRREDTANLPYPGVSALGSVEDSPAALEQFSEMRRTWSRFTVIAERSGR